MCLIEWPFFGVYPIFRHTHLVHRYLVISKWGNMVSISPDISGGCFNFTIALETSPRHQQVYCGGNVYINIMVTRKIVEIPRKSIDTWWVYMGLPVYHLYVYWRVIDEIHGFYSWKYRLKWKRPRGISLRIFHRVCMTEAWIHSIQHQHLWILMIFCTLKIPAHSMSSEHALYDYIYIRCFMWFWKWDVPYRGVSPIFRHTDLREQDLVVGATMTHGPKTGARWMARILRGRWDCWRWKWVCLKIVDTPKWNVEWGTWWYAMDENFRVALFWDKPISDGRRERTQLEKPQVAVLGCIPLSKWVIVPVIYMEYPHL